MAARKRDSARRRCSAETRLTAAACHPGIGTQPRVLALAVSAALLPWAPAAYSLPTGERTLFGKVEVSRPTSTSMNIDVKTQTAGSSFLGFSVQRGEAVNIQQLGPSSTYLIKDIGGKPSDIFGSLTANGQIFLSNTSGVLFGPNASVNVGALFATSLTIKDQDFKAGRYVWFNPGDSKGVETQRDGEQRAVINATSYAVLAGPQVKNDGLIVAHAGTVALAAGNRVSLDMVGDGLIKVNVDEAALNASAINSGRIEADGGNVLLTARSANALLDTVVNNSGVIRANSLIERNGEIILDGGSAGVVSNAGTLQAAGTDAGTVGGTVKVLGQYVGLFDGSKIDVSGDAGGGDVAVGGDFHGAGPDPNASRAYVSRGASINADAVNSGDGGRVVVWSDNGTTFYGSVSARGGARFGDGGTVEVSGKHALTYAGMTDLRAAKGTAGTLLLDPDEITITHDTAANTTGIGCADTGGGTGTCADPNVNADATGPFSDTTATTGVLTDGTLNAQLGFANVTVTTSTDGITANNDVVINASANTLALNSATYITLGGTYNAPLSLAFQTTLDLTNNPALNAGATALGAGTGSVIKGSGRTYVLTDGTPDAGTSGAVSWTDIGAVDDSAGTVDFNTSGSLTGNVNAGTLDFTGYGSGVTLDISNQTVTGVGGTAIASNVDANGLRSNSVTGSGASYTLDDAVQDKGTGGGYSWTAFQNINDGAGTVSFGTGGSVSGNATAYTLNYTTYGLGLTLNISAGTLANSGVGGTLAFNKVNANAGQTNTVSGSGASYTLDDAVQDKGTGGGYTWTAFQDINDGAGTVSFGTGGSISGSVTAHTLDYGAHGTAVTFDLSDGSGTTTGVGTTWSGVVTVMGSAGGDTITGTGRTYNLTGPNQGNGGSVNWTSFENLTDAGSGSFKMHSGADGSISGNLNGGTGSSMDYTGYTSAVTFSVSGAAGSTTGVGGTRTGVTSVIGSSASDVITGSGATYDLTSQNAGKSGSLSWTGFENISDSSGGLFNLSVASNNVTGTISSGGAGPASCAAVNPGTCANLNSNVDITSLSVSVGGTLLLTGNASSWNLTGAPQPVSFGASNPNANVFFNGACVGGPACGTVITITGSIGATVSQIATQALQEALDTDSVQKQIDYGFAGDVGTTPPMDHRIDDTGISTPQCFEQSREGEACTN